MSSEGLAGSTRTDTTRPGAEATGEEPAILSGKRVAIVAGIVILTFSLAAMVYAFAVSQPSDSFVRRFSGFGFVMSLFGPSVVTLFGVYWLRGLIRDAIAVSVFVGYFSLLYHFVTGNFDLSALVAQRLLDNFTGLAHTIAILYFTSIAGVEVVKQIFPTYRFTTATPVAGGISSGAPMAPAGPVASTTPTGANVGAPAAEPGAVVRADPPAQPNK